MKERITRAEVAAYKREILDKTVLVTPETAAEILSVSPRTVRRYLQEGILPAYHPRRSETRHQRGLPRGTRILASDLREFVRSIRLEGSG